MSKSCESMSEVREEIDRVDRLIVDLLAERTDYIRQAGLIKAGSQRRTRPLAN